MAVVSGSQNKRQVQIQKSKKKCSPRNKFKWKWKCENICVCVLNFSMCNWRYKSAFGMSNACHVAMVKRQKKIGCNFNWLDLTRLHTATDPINAAQKLQSKLPCFVMKILNDLKLPFKTFDQKWNEWEKIGIDTHTNTHTYVYRNHNVQSQLLGRCFILFFDIAALDDDDIISHMKTSTSNEQVAI